MKKSVPESAAMKTMMELEKRNQKVVSLKSVAGGTRSTDA